MRVYLSSPANHQQLEHCGGHDVLVSYGAWRPFWQDYIPTFRRFIIDSGAFSVMNRGLKIDLAQYAAWAERFVGHADAIAGLDDIGGDWKQSLANYKAFPIGFPTIHDTDPRELLEELIGIAEERGGWIGIGLAPPREGKEEFVRWACSQIPSELHVHGWALGGLYSHVRRLDSVDTTRWFRGAQRIKMNAECNHLTMGECLDIAIKRIVRNERVIKDPEPSLFVEGADDEA